MYQERKRHINTIFLAGDHPEGGGSFRSGVQGSKIHDVLSSELKKHKYFSPRYPTGKTGDWGDQTEF